MHVFKRRTNTRIAFIPKIGLKQNSIYLMHMNISNFCLGTLGVQTVVLLCKKGSSCIRTQDTVIKKYYHCQTIMFVDPKYICIWAYIIFCHVEHVISEQCLKTKIIEKLFHTNACSFLCKPLFL